MRPINQIICDLSQPFPRYEKDKTKGGQVIKFLPWTACRQILDECAPGWHSEVKSVAEVAGRIVAIVRLYIPAAEGLIYREGAAQVKDPEKGEKIYGDPTKNATSDAFRRAAGMFGVGSYLRGKAQTFDGPKSVQSKPATPRVYEGQATERQPTRESVPPPAKQADERRAALELQAPLPKASDWAMGEAPKESLQQLLIECTELGFGEPQQLGRLRSLTGVPEFVMTDLRILDAATAAKVISSLKQTVISLRAAHERGSRAA